MNIFSKNIRFLTIVVLGLMLCANVPVQAMFATARARVAGLTAGYATRAAFAAKPSPGMAQLGMLKNMSSRTSMQTPSMFNRWSNRVTGVFQPFYNYVRSFSSAANVPPVLKNNDASVSGVDDSIVYDERTIRSMFYKNDLKEISLWLERLDKNPHKSDIAGRIAIYNIDIFDKDRQSPAFEWILSRCSTADVDKVADVVAGRFTKTYWDTILMVAKYCGSAGANKFASAMIDQNGVFQTVQHFSTFEERYLKKCDKDYAEKLVLDLVLQVDNMSDLVKMCTYSASLSETLEALKNKQTKNGVLSDVQENHDSTIIAEFKQVLRKKWRVENGALQDAQLSRELTIDELKKIILFGTAETENTQSHGHIDRNSGLVSDFVSNINDKHILQMFVKALSQEKEIAAQGRIVKYHGMLPDDHFRCELVTRLAALMYDVPDKWFFLRFFNTFGKMLDITKKEQGKDVLMMVHTLNDALQEKLLKGQQYENNRDYRALCLFANSALLGCMNKRGCCTADYVYRCKTQRNVGFTVKELMDAVGFKGRPEFAKICEELQELQVMNRNLSQYGRLLRITIPKEHINQVSYPADGGGPLKKVKIGDKLTTDMAAIASAYTTPEKEIANPDDTEAVLVLPKMLDPKNPCNVQMDVLFAGDHQKYAGYQRKFDAVMQKLRDIIYYQSKNKQYNKLIRNFEPTMRYGTYAHKK